VPPPAHDGGRTLRFRVDDVRRYAERVEIELRAQDVAALLGLKQPQVGAAVRAARWGVVPPPAGRDRRGWRWSPLRVREWRDARLD
jgi:hypothetical protein